MELATKFTRDSEQDKWREVFAAENVPAGFSHSEPGRGCFARAGLKHPTAVHLLELRGYFARRRFLCEPVDRQSNLDQNRREIG